MRAEWNDSVEQIWWLAWAAHALPNVHNLFIALGQNYPYGQNFGANGSMLALGVLFAPITKIFGPVVTSSVRLSLAHQAIDVTGIDPAAAPLRLLRGILAQRVRWFQGDAASLPPMQVDLATMTGNVAQVFLTDDEWITTLERRMVTARPAVG